MIRTHQYITHQIVFVLAAGFIFAQAIEGPAQCLYNSSFDHLQPYCRVDGHKEICHGQICRRYDPKNEEGKVAFCCRSIHKHHNREHCCNEQEFCKEHEWDVNNCPNWNSQIIWSWILITFGLLLVPLIILVLCYCLSSCPLYKQYRGRGEADGSIARWTNTSNRLSNSHHTAPGMVVYPTPPPSYLEVTNGKVMAEPQSQSQCHVNEAMESDTDNPNMPNSCSEAPPPYESIRTI